MIILRFESPPKRTGKWQIGRHGLYVRAYKQRTGSGRCYWYLRDDDTGIERKFNKYHEFCQAWVGICMLAWTVDKWAYYGIEAPLS